MTREDVNRMTPEERKMLLADAISNHVKDLAETAAHRKRTAKMELGISYEEFDQAWDLAYKTACLKFDQMSDIEFMLMTVIASVEKGIITTEELMDIKEN